MMLNLRWWVLLSKSEYHALQVKEEETIKHMAQTISQLMDECAHRGEEINRLEGRVHQGIGSMVE